MCVCVVVRGTVVVGGAGWRVSRGCEETVVLARNGRSATNLPSRVRPPVSPAAGCLFTIHSPPSNTTVPVHHLGA